MSDHSSVSCHYKDRMTVFGATRKVAVLNAGRTIADIERKQTLRNWQGERYRSHVLSRVIIRTRDWAGFFGKTFTD